MSEERTSKRGNVFGCDPHKRTVTATVLDERGGVLGTEVFATTRAGLAAMTRWALSFGAVDRWGIEGAAGPGSRTARFLSAAGHDVRDVCPNRTNLRRRARQHGKTDAADSVWIARETLAHPDLPAAFKRAGGDAGPDETREQIALWNRARRSLLASRQHLLNEAESLLAVLDDDIALPDCRDVRRRLRVLAGRDRSVDHDVVTALQLQLLDQLTADIFALDAREKTVTRELAALIDAAGSTLTTLTGLAERSVAELLAEVGDPRRFTEAGFASFNGTAPLAASSAEGTDQPRRHRLNRGGNRRVNAVLYRMAITQLRCDPRAQAVVANARQRGHNKREAIRILKRHLSNVVHRHMLNDLAKQSNTSSSLT